MHCGTADNLRYKMTVPRLHVLFILLSNVIFATIFQQEQFNTSIFV